LWGTGSYTKEKPELNAAPDAFAASTLDSNKVLQMQVRGLEGKDEDCGHLLTFLAWGAESSRDVRFSSEAVLCFRFWAEKLLLTWSQQWTPGSSPQTKV
jgi:hypothetical protein